MRRRFLLSALLALPLVSISGCDKGSPVTPEGTTIALSASPARIASATGSTTVTAVLRRPNGTPVNPGLEVRFSTTLGSIEEVLLTDRDGVARATLRGDGRIGTAMVGASAGGGSSSGTTGNVSATLSVEIGTAAGAASLQAIPSSIPENGGVIQLLVLVRDDKGQPLPNALVNFSSPLGRLGKGGTFQRTDGNGRASDSLTLTIAEISTLTSDTFDVSVEVSSGAAAALTDTFRISIQRAPRADFTFSLSVSESTAAFTDTSSPRPTSWDWDFGDGSAHSTAQNPVHVYTLSPTNRSFLVTLTARNAVGTGSITKLITFPAN